MLPLTAPSPNTMSHLTSSPTQNNFEVVPIAKEKSRIHPYMFCPSALHDSKPHSNSQMRPQGMMSVSRCHG